MQQHRGGGTGASSPSDADEREADQVGRSVARGRSANVQQAAGAAVHGDWWDEVGAWLSTVTHDVEEAVGLESPEEANLGRADAFVSHGTYGPEEIQPSTGSGGFKASYAPGHAGIEDITMNVKVTFKDLVTLKGDVAAPTETRWQPAADRINALRVADRAAAAENYIWTPAGKSAFLTDLKSQVEGAWSNQ